jgi:endonuclease-3
MLKGKELEKVRARVPGLVRALRKAYPHSRTALHYQNPLQILVATILAAQSTDETVNKVTPDLFRKYPTAAALARADRAELEREIHATGFFRNKAKSILGAARAIVEDHGGRVPSTMAELVELPGVGRKTANIVLSAGFRRAEGIAVDTHVRRLSGRLGLSRETDPDKIEQDLLAVVPRKDWLDFNSILVSHGRKVCQARKPLCPQCVVRRLCPSAGLYYPELKKELRKAEP